MEGISQLVGDSLARHGIEPSLDHLRIEWSRWFRCASSFDVLLVPAKAGIFVLAEEIGPSEGLERRASSPAGSSDHNQVRGKRLLALFQISQADDLGMTLGRLFLPGNPLRERLESGTCFARYAVIEDADERTVAFAIFQHWMQDSAEAASGISDQQKPGGADTLVRDAAPSSSSAWGVGFKEAQVREVKDRELKENLFRPMPLPSGF
jgi:hypothetical protein